MKTSIKKITASLIITLISLALANAQQIHIMQSNSNDEYEESIRFMDLELDSVTICLHIDYYVLSSFGAPLSIDTITNHIKPRTSFNIKYSRLSGRTNLEIVYIDCQRVYDVNGVMYHEFDQVLEIVKTESLKSIMNKY